MGAVAAADANGLIHPHGLLAQNAPQQGLRSGRPVQGTGAGLERKGGIDRTGHGLLQVGLLLDRLLRVRLLRVRLLRVRLGRNGLGP